MYSRIVPKSLESSLRVPLSLQPSNDQQRVAHVVAVQSTSSSMLPMSATTAGKGKVGDEGVEKQACHASPVRASSLQVESVGAIIARLTATMAVCGRRSSRSSHQLLALGGRRG